MAEEEEDVTRKAFAHSMTETHATHPKETARARKGGLNSDPTISPLLVPWGLLPPLVRLVHTQDFLVSSGLFATASCLSSCWPRGGLAGLHHRRERRMGHPPSSTSPRLSSRTKRTEQNRTEQGRPHTTTHTLHSARWPISPYQTLASGPWLSIDAGTAKGLGIQARPPGGAYHCQAHLRSTLYARCPRPDQLLLPHPHLSPISQHTHTIQATTLFLPPLAALLVLAATAWDHHHAASDGATAVVSSVMQPTHVVALFPISPDRNQVSVRKSVSCICLLRPSPRLCVLGSSVPHAAHVFV